MTPYEITLFLKCATSPWYITKREHAGSDLFDKTVKDFVELGLLKEGVLDDYELTDRGMAYFVALKQMPLPVASWEIKWAPDPKREGHERPVHKANWRIND